MQSGFLLITYGVQFFLFVGYLFYVIFRTYPEADDQISLMSWIGGLLGVLTLGLLVSVALVIPRMPVTEAIVASMLVIADIAGLYLLVDDTRRRSRELNSVMETITE
jgi:uncharacterized membrane protein YdcZ (DUF606 family)